MKNSTPLVSVVIPTYNRENLIKQTIKSVLNQTFENFELIIVDNNSTDNTVEIVQEFAVNDNRVKIHVNNKNVGLYPNWNKGLELAKGKYYKHLSSDNLIDKDFLLRTVAPLEENKNIDIVFTTMRNIDYNGSVINYSRRFSKNGIVETKDFIEKCIKYMDDYPGAPDNQLIRRSLISENNIRYDSKIFPYSADFKFTLDCLFQTGDEVYTINDELCYLRIHEDTNTGDKCFSEDRFNEFEEYAKILGVAKSSAGLSRMTLILFYNLFLKSPRKAIHYYRKRNKRFSKLKRYDLKNSILLAYEKVLQIIYRTEYTYFR